MERSFVGENAAEHERLRRLVTASNEHDLARPAAGWTVAAVLAHIGFWDARALHLLDKWQSGPRPSEEDCEPEDLDWANDAGKPLCLALPTRVAASLALRRAEQVDARIAALSDGTLAANPEAGSPLNPSRAEHRRVHLDEIELLLGPGGGQAVWRQSSSSVNLSSHYICYVVL